MNERKRKVSIIVLSFSIPALLMLAFCMVRGIAPFGDGTFLYQDMKRQYAEFYSFYQKTIRQAFTGGLFSYSTGIGLGDTTAGIFTYYMTSPLLIPFLFLPVKVFPSAITFLITVKCALCGLTMCVYLGSKPGGYRFRILPFSVSYAFCGFALLNLTNTMWIDVMVLSPVLILLCEQMLGAGAYASDIASGSKNLAHGDPSRTCIYIKYILCVGACLFLNYYIAWMVLLFTAVYGIVYIIPDVVSHKYAGGKEILCKLANWFIATVWGALLSAITSIPAYAVLKGSAKNITDKTVENLLYIDSAGMSEPHTLNPMDILSKAFSLGFDADQIFFGYPAIYCGLLLVPLTLLFFMKKRISRADKIRAFVMFLIMGASFSFDKVNILWHAGSRPQGYLYRYSFLFSFLMISCAYEAFKGIEQTDIRQIVCACGITSALLIPAILMHYGYLNSTKAVYNLVLLVAGGGIYVMLTRVSQRKTVALLLALMFFFGLADAGLNLNMYYSTMGSNSLSREAFVSGYEERKALIGENITDADGQLTQVYRIESTSRISDNDAMLLGYNSTATYSSLTGVNDRIFMKRLGFSDNGIYTEYSPGNTASADTILSITGLICEDENGELIYKKNDLTLPMLTGLTGDTAEQTASSFNSSGGTEAAPADDPFAFTQAYLDEISGSHTDVLVPASFSDDGLSQADGSGTAMDEKCVISYRVTAPINGKMYLYISNVLKYGNDLMITVDDADTYPFGNASCNGVICIGERASGETLTVSVAGIGTGTTTASESAATEQDLSGDLHIVSEDTDALSSIIASASERGGDLITGKKCMTGSVPAKSESVICAIPYDPDLKVTLGGAELSTSSFADEYLLIDIPDEAASTTSDTLDITITYKNTRSIAGVIITLLSLTALVIFYIISSKQYSSRAK